MENNLQEKELNGKLLYDDHDERWVNKGYIIFQCEKTQAYQNRLKDK